MIQKRVRFYENYGDKTHIYECDNTIYTSVSKIISKYEEEYDEESWSWYLAIKLYYVGDFIDDKRGDWYIGGEKKDESIKAHYPIKVWDDQKQGQKRKFVSIRGLDKAYLYKFVDGVSYRVELAILRTKVLTKWKNKNRRASEGGTAYHHQQEAKNIYERYGIHIEEFKAKEKQKGYKESFLDLYKEVRDGLEPELIVFNHDLQIAGQLDEPIFETKGRIRYVDIDDYKTNEDGIDRENKFQRFNYPINHLEVTKFNHYAIQQSLYAYLLELEGFVPRQLRLKWRKIDFDTGEELDREDIIVPYLRKEVIDILEHFKGTKEKKKSVWDF